MKKIGVLASLLVLCSCGAVSESKSVIESPSASATEELNSSLEASASEIISSSIEESSEVISSSSESSSEVDKGELIIDSMIIYLGNKAKKIPYEFTNKDFEEKIEYYFDGDKIDIDDDGNVVALEAGMTKVTAVTSNFEVNFRIRSIGDGNFANDVKFMINQQKLHDHDENTTLFAGDSFFDPRSFWSTFYDDIDGNVYDTAISATTLEGWQCYAERLIYNVAPKNVVFHLGTNDFWDLNKTVDGVYSSFTKLMEDVHENLPNAHIYYFSIENRSYVMPSKTLDATIKALNDYNALAKAYCDERDYMTFIDSFSYFTDDDGRCITTMFKDGTHPKAEHYKFFVDALEEAGAGISFKEKEPEKEAEPGTINDWTNSESMMWGAGKTISYNDNALVSEFIMEGKIKFSFTTSNNAHLGFQFGGDANNRFLLWNSGLNGKLYYCGAFNGIYHNSSADYCNYPTENELTWKVLVTAKNAYLFINDELQVVCTNISPASFYVASEFMNVTFSENKIYLKGDESGVYEELVATNEIKEYEDSSSNQSQYIEV